MSDDQRSTTMLYTTRIGINSEQRPSRDTDYVNSSILSQADDNGVLYLVVFYSKNLLPIEYNYKIYDKELLVIIRCLEY